MTPFHGSRAWHHKALAAGTLVIILCIACNPELASLVPLLDAYGLDVLLCLFSAQVTVILADVVLPYLQVLHQRIGKPLLQPVSQLAFAACGGYLRQLWWHTVTANNLPFRPLRTRS